METIEESENNIMKNQFLHVRSRFAKSLSPRQEEEEESLLEGNSPSDHYQIGMKSSGPAVSPKSRIGSN